MNYIKLIIFVFVFILAVSFAAKNAQPITLAYYFNWETRPFPMYLLIFIPFFIGIVGGVSWGLAAGWTSKTPSSDSPNRTGSWRKS